jgi:hypothetical protein
LTFTGNNFTFSPSGVSGNKKQKIFPGLNLKCPEKQPERALYRVSGCIGKKTSPPLPYRVFPDFLPCFLEPAEFCR